MGSHFLLQKPEILVLFDTPRAPAPAAGMTDGDAIGHAARPWFGRLSGPQILVDNQWVTQEWVHL